MPKTNKELKETFKGLSKVAEDLMILATQKNEMGIWLLANSIYSNTQEFYFFYSSNGDEK